MERQALHELCHQVVQALVHEQGWSLTPSGLQDLVEAIFPFAQHLPDPTLQALRIIVLNYKLDGLMVQQMLMPQSALGNKSWAEWRTHFLKIASVKELAAEDAEDLVQTVYSEALKALLTFRFQSRLNTYLVAIFKVELRRMGNDVWEGQLPNQPGLEYFVQAVDGGGNVAVQDNKGHYFILGEQPSSTIYLPIILGISGRLPMDSSTKTTLFLPSVIKN